jgi:phosphate transport system protein
VLNEIIRLLKRDNLMVQALNECYEMVDLCREMVKASVESLRERDDVSIDLDIYKADKQLNRFERDVRRKVMTHLAVRNTADINAGLVLVSIVIDLERIGDYSKNIYELAVNHPQRLHGGALEEQLAKTVTMAGDNFGRSVEAFKSNDVEEALQLMQDYKEDISNACREMEIALVTGAVDLPAKEAVTVALFVRFLKRISSHSRNLVSSIANPFPRIGYKSKGD